MEEKNNKDPLLKSNSGKTIAIVFRVASILENQSRFTYLRNFSWKKIKGLENSILMKIPFSWKIQFIEKLRRATKLQKRSTGGASDENGHNFC